MLSALDQALAACRRPLSAEGRARRPALSEELARQTPVPDAAERAALDELAAGAPVLTAGQQAGLAGGPALILWKALALLAAADRLASPLGRRPLCLFWLEANDHDWAEAAAPGFPLAPAPPPPDSEGRPVGRIALDAAWWEAERASLEPCLDGWPEGERTVLLAALRGTLAEQTRALLRVLFRGSGLLILDPSRAGCRELGAPFATRLGGLEGELIEALGRDTRRLLAAGMAAPVTVDERPPWFLEDGEGRRRRAEPGAALDAARFSPGVLTRPLLQDWLLEPALVFLGPSERLYHAQLEGARALLDLPAPPALPRPHVQLARRGDAETWRGLGADPWQPPQAGRPWPDAVLERLPGGEALRGRLERLAAAQAELLAFCAGARPDLEQLARRQEAWGEQVGQALRGAHKSAHKEELRRLHSLAAWQDGPAGPQERRVNGLALLGRLGGRPVLEALRRELDPFAEGQQRFVCDAATVAVMRE